VSLEAIVKRLGAPHMELTYEDLQRFRGAIIYVWTRGGAVLYIGVSSNGLERPIARSREHLRGFEPGDQLTIWRAPADPAQLYDLEASLICALRPRHNKPNGGEPCPGCGRRWKRRHRSGGRCGWCQHLAPALR
jgi:hypothetical protein